MTIKTKLQMLLVPIIIIPVLVTAFTFARNTSSSIRSLNDENMLRNIDIIINHLDQENQIIERLGILNTQYYEQNAKEHSLNFISNLEIHNGHIQLYDHPMRSLIIGDGLLDADFYNMLYMKLHENSSIMIHNINDENFIVYYKYFQPWDWILTIHMSEDVIFDSINKSINQIFLIVIGLLILSGILLYHVTNRLLSPLHTLTQSAKAIGEGNYYQRISVKSEDEFGELAIVFNNMSSTLSKTFEELNQLTEELTAMNDALEHRVELRTLELQDANDELETSIQHLQSTQDELVETKKLSALGSLVSGIAHELNTPLGNAITTASFIIKKTESLINSADQEKTDDSGATDELQDLLKSATIVFNNLQRTSEIVNTFKLIAVDQTKEVKRYFDLTRYLEQIVQNLSVLTKEKHHDFTLMVTDGLYMNSYPGVISQVISQLVMNSLKHGFEGVEHGLIRIKAYESTHNKIVIEYEDNGVGVSDEERTRIFEPFFTTKMSKGTSGLGLNIVYNLVTGVLDGKIIAESPNMGGLKIRLILPQKVKDDDDENM